jgi:hypothetical protein
MIDAMKQALERLTMWLEDSPDTAVIEDHWAVDALRQAIAEAEKQAEFDKEFAIYAESDEGKARSKQADTYSDIVSDGGLDPRNKNDTNLKQEIEKEPVGWLTKELMADYFDLIADGINTNNAEMIQHKSYQLRKGEK